MEVTVTMADCEQVGMGFIIIGLVTYLLGPIEAWVWFFVGAGYILMPQLSARLRGGDGE